ncbi:MAG TPA: hypothetical protein VMV69_07875 [Pirellulales bacterium]|nr:hypothetical protein [Pirellulales bacterium]
MAIEVKCPNEHLLKIGSGLAGRTVRCPRCQAAVVVPQPLREVSEQAILEFLGPAPMNPVRAAAPGLPPEADPPAEPAVLRLRGHLGEFKTCPKCQREVRAAYDICPHCNTYFSDWREVLRRMTGA